MLNGAKVQVADIRVTPDTLNASRAIKGDTIFVTLSLLNQGEDFQVSAMSAEPQQLPNRPEVVVRGKGVVGERAARASSNLDIILIIVSPLSILVTIIVLYMSLKNLR